MTPQTAYIYRATVLEVHDGDTFTADLDLGFNIHIQYRVRLAGCNAIELKDSGGQEARQHLLTLLPLGSVCLVSSVHYDKYGGRIDAVVRIGEARDEARDSVALIMISDGYAAAWDGTGPRPTPPWPIRGEWVE
jgi:endonuclease YncB( thermonuclease family)